jgi:hypothetical protein
MRSKVSNDELRTQLEALKRKVEELEAAQAGAPQGLTDADIHYDTPYRIRAGSNRNKWLPVVVVDKGEWEKAGHFYRLERTDGVKTQGPPIMRTAAEIYPAEEESTAPAKRRA